MPIVSLQFDPRDGRPRYVGTSDLKTPAAAIKRGNYFSFDTDSPGHVWRRELRALGLEPAGVLLEEVATEAEAKARRIVWQYRLEEAGADLVNASSLCRRREGGAAAGATGGTGARRAGPAL